MRPFPTAAALAALACTLIAGTATAQSVKGVVQGAGAPIANSTVTLWAATAGAPAKLGEARTGTDGKFEIRHEPPDKDAVLYLVAAGGRPGAKGGDNPAIALLAVLGPKAPDVVTINELTTVASAFTSARFLQGQALSGNPLGLRIAAGNVPNFVSLQTGWYGKVILDPINLTQTTAMANLNTLASLVTATFTVADAGWRTRFFAAATPLGGATPTNTLEAVAGIARAPWNNAATLYALFDEVYPQPKDGARRATRFVPYLAYAPADFALSLVFAGGGTSANGRFMFDKDGNLWSGQNWMPGSQSGVVHNIGGGVTKFSPNGTALSPPLTGFTGMGIDGVGWGTAVTLDKVWITSFNGKILVMDFDGKPIGKESDFPFKERLTGLMGIGVAANGDVWIADGVGNQLLYFPGGRVKDGRIVKVAGLKSPFDVSIDTQNRVWVSNSSSDVITRFPASDPTKAETFRAGISVRGIALDSKGNLWSASLMDLTFPPPTIPDGVSIMEQFKLVTQAVLNYITPTRTTGAINMIRPDGTQPAPMGFTGPAVSVPWGVNIDGNDDVWFGTMLGESVVLMAGDGTKGHPAGTKTGDVIHQFQSGSIQLITDVSIDPAGNVWAANNWNSITAAMADRNIGPTSTWGGGSGFTVIYGVAAPVKAPRMGEVRPN